MTSPTGPVDWGAYPGGLLEQVMAVLLLQERRRAQHGRPSRGDGGVDVYDPVADGYHVYQVKRHSTAPSLRAKRRRSRPRSVRCNRRLGSADPSGGGPSCCRSIRPVATTSGAVAPHLRRRHWRRVRVGPRDDWHLEGRWIAPTLVNTNATTELAEVLYRLPDPSEGPSPDGEVEDLTT